jgi:Virulence-associated protein E
VKIDPVRDYLDGLRWDGTSRIDTWLTTYGKAEDNEYTRAVGAIVLVAAVRRVRQPGWDLALLRLRETIYHQFKFDPTTETVHTAVMTLASHHCFQQIR